MNLFEKRTEEGIERGLYLYRDGIQIICRGRLFTLNYNRAHLLFGSVFRMVNTQEAEGIEFHLIPPRIHKARFTTPMGIEEE